MIEILDEENLTSDFVGPNLSLRYNFAEPISFILSNVINGCPLNGLTCHYHLAIDNIY